MHTSLQREQEPLSAEVKNLFIAAIDTGNNFDRLWLISPMRRMADAQVHLRLLDY